MQSWLKTMQGKAAPDANEEFTNHSPKPSVKKFNKPIGMNMNT